VQLTTVPINVAGKEAAPNEIVDVVLDLFRRCVGFQHQIADLDLTPCLDDVQQLSLLLNPGEILRLGVSSNDEEDAGSNKRQHQHTRKERTAECSARCLQGAFLIAEEQPQADRDAEHDASTGQDDPDGATGWIQPLLLLRGAHRPASIKYVSMT